MLSNISRKLLNCLNISGKNLSCHQKKQTLRLICQGQTFGLVEGQKRWSNPYDWGFAGVPGSIKISLKSWELKCTLAMPAHPESGLNTASIGGWRRKTNIPEEGRYFLGGNIFTNKNTSITQLELLVKLPQRQDWRTSTWENQVISFGDHSINKKSAWLRFFFATSHVTWRIPNFEKKQVVGCYFSGKKTQQIHLEPPKTPSPSPTALQLMILTDPKKAQGHRSFLTSWVSGKISWIYTPEN